MHSAPPPNEDLAVWLQESGKRRFSVQSGQVEAPVEPSQVAVPVEPRPRPLRRAANIPTRRWLGISAVAAVAYLQYFYADVFLQIVTSPSIVFFVLMHGQLPPL